MGEYRTLLLADEGAVRIITLNRPELYNPIDQTSAPELIKVLEDSDRAPEIKALVLTGAGKAFSGGGNLKAMAQVLESGEKPGLFFSELVALFNRLIITMRRLKKPVVCAVNGVASGGGLGLALACDLVLAVNTASFDPGYIRIALSPDGGATAFFTRLIGLKRASEFFLLGQPISIQKAHEWGMVNQLAEPGELLPQAVECARKLGQGPAGALASTKALLNQAVFADLESVLEKERLKMSDLSDRPDFAEGVKAFFEKRKPSFT